MDKPKPGKNQSEKYGALVPSGKRIDHNENLQERKQRELGAAFNRMSSSNDSEAESAFARARNITAEIGITFDAILKSARDAKNLRDINKNLGKQLKQAMQENAKYRSMHISYKIKGHLIQYSKLSTQALIYSSPIILTILLFFLGFASASGASLLVMLTGLYNAARGVMKSHNRRILLGTVLILAGGTGISIAAERDAPIVHREQLTMIENMNRDHELGPRTLYIDYPLSHMTRIARVVGIQDSLKISLQGSANTLNVTCAKYYLNEITVPQIERGDAVPPEEPDIFHKTPVATFGDCDLYTRLKNL